MLYGLIRGLRRRLGEAIDVVVLSSQADVSARYHPEFTFREPLSRLVLRAARAPRTRLGRKLERGILRRISLARFRLGFEATARGVPGGERLLTRAERELVALLAGGGFVISSGGTYLVENYSMDGRVLEFRAAMRLGLPLALCTQSMGPFTARSRKLLRPVFDYCRLILLRDEASLDHLRSTGAERTPAAVVGDVAFTLGNAAAIRDARTRSLPTDRPLRIGISVRDWPFFKTKTPDEGMASVRAAFGGLADWLRVQGADVEFVSTCQGIPEYWKDDSKTAMDVVRGSSHADEARIDARFREPDALLEHFRSFDLMVSMRMHAAILALAAGVPVLPVAYEPKTRELFGRLGFADWVIDVESLNAGSLVDMADRILAELPTRRAALFDAVAAEMRSAEEGLDLLAAEIDR